MRSCSKLHKHSNKQHWQIKPINIHCSNQQFKGYNRQHNKCHNNQHNQQHQEKNNGR